MAWKITIGLVLLLSAFGAGYCTNWLEQREYIDGLDQRAVELRSRVAEVERLHLEAEQRIGELSDRIERAQSIVVRLSEQTGTIAEKVKRVIEN
jgi:uncharacterized coiled-coil protein SlyX